MYIRAHVKFCCTYTVFPEPFLRKLFIVYTLDSIAYCIVCFSTTAPQYYSNKYIQLYNVFS